jgi:hypothetical protein
MKIEGPKIGFLLVCILNPLFAIYPLGIWIKVYVYLILSKVPIRLVKAISPNPKQSIKAGDCYT